MDVPVNDESFVKELTVVINNNHIDSLCKTPDYILANLIHSWLMSYFIAVSDRDYHMQSLNQKEEVNNG